MARRETAEHIAQRMLLGEPIQLVDARNAQAWASANLKLPGALRIPADQVHLHAHRLSRGRPVVTYCTSPEEDAAERVAERLEELGFEDTAILEGGYDRWLEAGFPIEGKQAGDEAARSA